MIAGDNNSPILYIYRRNYSEFVTLFFKKFWVYNKKYRHGECAMAI